jgi:hypothetical protein
MIAEAVIVLAAMGLVLDPPAKYDYPPNPPPIVEETTLEEIARRCASTVLPKGYFVLACTLPPSPYNKCVIAWPKGTPRNNALWRHERAHCNGWVHD